MYNKPSRIVAQSFFARPNSRRLAWGFAAATSLFAMVAAFGTANDAPMPLQTQPVELLLSPPVQSLGTEPASAYMHEDRFQRGDTLSTLLDRLGVDEAEARRVLAAPQAAAPFRWLRPGTTVQAKTSDDGELLGLWFMAPGDRLIRIQQQGSGFQVEALPAELTREAVMKSGEIRSSLFAATDSAGIPDNIATQLADVFSGDIDFHRDLRKSDRFTVVYEMLSNQGTQVRAGRLLAAEFVNQQRVLRAVWFQDAGGKGGYYTPEGKNLRKAFLRSPLEFSRVTSGFALRFHPILQKWRAHKGTDYGAPIGTRVRVTGDGVVDYAGQQAGYGNLVRVRHNGGLSTWYAHLNGFAKRIKAGARVAQGDIIGFVGRTGWTTGPHLHYEIRVHNENRNPLTIALPAAESIPVQRLAAFRLATELLGARLDLLRDTNLALLE